MQLGKLDVLSCFLLSNSELAAGVRLGELCMSSVMPGQRMSRVCGAG